MSESLHPIQLAARLSGLSTYVIRIWEQRHSAVEPARTVGNRRLYSQADIERLSLLREVTQAGHSIGQVAKLPTERLRELAAASATFHLVSDQPARAEDSDESSLEASLAAIRSLDGNRLERELTEAAKRTGGMGVLHRLIAPLVRSVGDAWHDGRITAAHEHFATGIIRSFLSNHSKPFDVSARAPVLVVATPAGQLHELGALLAASVASNLGWKVTYLGASLPALEIAGAAQQQNARAVAVSLVYPNDDPALPTELSVLRSALPINTTLIVGGRGMAAHREFLAGLGATLVDDLEDLGSVLDALRKPGNMGATPSD